MGDMLWKLFGRTDGQGKHYIPPTSLKRGYNDLTEILKTIPGKIIANELQLEAVRGSVTILKTALIPKL